MRKDGYSYVAIKPEAYKLSQELMRASGEEINVIVYHALQLYEREYCGPDTNSGKILKVLRNKE